MVLLMVTMSLAWAANVVVQSPDSPNLEYRAYMTAHGAARTPSDAIMMNRPSPAARERLISEFAEAQKIFLSGTVAAARKSLEELLARSGDEDWSKTEREIFLKTALRRAQLATSDAELWLKLALAIGHDLSIDRTLFPPPLIQSFLDLKKRTPMIRPHIPGLGTEWSRVLIHGVPCSQERCPEFPDLDTALRVTWISDKWQPFSTAIRLTRIEHQIPPRKAWVAGVCHKPRFDKAAEQFLNKDVFFNLSCAKTAIAVNKVNFNPVAAAGAVTMFDEPKRERPVYRSPWLWAGIGTAVAILVVQSQQKQEKKDPSTSYGY